MVIGVCTGGCSPEPKKLYAKGRCLPCYNKEARKNKKPKEEGESVTLEKKEKEEEETLVTAPDKPDKKEKKKDPPKKDLRPLYEETAFYIINKIKHLCREPGNTASEIKLLVEALSKLDDIVFAMERNKDE